MEPIFTAQQLAEVRAYHAPKYTYAALDTVLWPLVLVVAVRFLTRPLYQLSTRWAAWLDQRSGALRVAGRVAQRLWGGPGWGVALLFSLLLFGVFAAVELPAQIYFGYFREHAYGLSRSAPGVFALDELKAHAVLAVAVSTLAFGLFGLARRVRQWWWVLGLVASVLMIGSTALDPYRSRLYVTQVPLPEGELRQRITALMAQAHLDFRDVLVDQTSSRTVRLQASFAGTGPTRTIVLNDSLLNSLTTDEVLAAVAHEAGHLDEARWPGRLGAALALLAFLGLVELLFRAAASRSWFGIKERADVRLLPLILLVFDLAMTAAGPLSGAASRAREYAADRSAVQLTKNPEAFRSMLLKATRVNKMDPAPPRWYVLLGMSHPPMGERIAAVGTMTDGG